jgi:hypothetical protein
LNYRDLKAFDLPVIREALLVLKKGNPFLLHLIFLIVFYNKKFISALYRAYPAATYRTMPVPCLSFLSVGTLGGIASCRQIYLVPIIRK